MSEIKYEVFQMEKLALSTFFCTSTLVFSHLVSKLVSEISVGSGYAVPTTKSRIVGVLFKSSNLGREIIRKQKCIKNYYKKG